MKVVFFGAGEWLRYLLEDEKIKFLDIVGIVDSNPSKCGTFGDYQVVSPQKIADMQYDKIIVSVSSKYYSEIYEYLIREQNIPNEKIVRWEDIIVPQLCNMGDVELIGSTDVCYCIQDLVSQKLILAKNDLEQFFFYGEHKVINKFWHYFEIYERFFSAYRNKSIKMLEIGVFKGGSLQMWKNYFGNDSLIVGIDINPICKEFEEKGIEICIGSQEDEGFLKSVSEKYGPFDIILDDGSHIMKHQIASFETLFSEVNDGGVYLCEDTHTSYFSEYDGILWGKNTFIEYSKNWIDGLHKQYVDRKDKKFISLHADNIKACHYYDSMVVIEKGRRKESIVSMEGDTKCIDS